MYDSRGELVVLVVVIGAEMERKRSQLSKSFMGVKMSSKEMDRKSICCVKPSPGVKSDENNRTWAARARPNFLKSRKSLLPYGVYILDTEYKGLVKAACNDGH